MKKEHYIIAFIVITLLYHNTNSYAQSPQPTNYYFCALNGTCYNDANDYKVRLINEEFTPEMTTLITESFATNHPNYTILASASKLYNCHGYAYSVFQGGEKLNITWKDCICISIGNTIASYIEISENDAQAGDIATILNPNDNGTYSIHSSIVVNADTMVSKLGDNPLFKHYKYDSYIVNETGLGTIANYVYYRRVINNDIQGPSVFNGTGTYTFDYDVAPTSCTWSVEPAAMFQTASGSGYTANLSYATPLAYLAPKHLICTACPMVFTAISLDAVNIRIRVN